ncbi:hypothetical protein AA18889_0612 [Acetobacter senegalensis DSM 18889]|nr:hypothetical protein AA18889_0612 [Acetobacter senegalensis DSM 18889]
MPVWGFIKTEMKGAQISPWFLSHLDWKQLFCGVVSKDQTLPGKFCSKMEMCWYGVGLIAYAFMELNPSAKAHTPEQEKHG